MTKKELKRLITKAELEFEKCWNVLAELKFAKPSNAVAKDIVGFQPRLARTFFSLEHAYNLLRSKEKALIERKDKVSKSYFANRLRRMSAYRKILDGTIDVGKILGDSFAWLFYEKETKLLKEHQKHQRITRSAIGTGGIGEITFIENLPKINDYLVIYHGTTTFLRLGDISMVDMRTLKVAAIGELKSHRLGETQIVVTVNLVGHKLTNALIPSGPRQTGHSEVIPKLDSQRLEQLKRQINTIKNSFKPSVTNTLKSHPSVNVDWNIEKLTKLYKLSNIRRFRYVKADRGLLLVGIRLKRATLWSTLAISDKTCGKEKMSGLEKGAAEIVDKTLSDNSLTTGFLPYSSCGRYALMLGMRPLLWWPLERKIIRALIFRRFIVMTLYNPAFLVKDLRELGFEVICERGTNLTIKKLYRGSLLEFKGFDYFYSMIQTYLFPEEKVCSLIEKTVASLNKAEFPFPAVIHLDLNFEF